MKSVFSKSGSGRSCLGEIEKFSRRIDIFKITLIVEGNIVSRDWSSHLHGSHNTHTFDNSVHVWHKVNHCCVVLLIKSSGGFNRNHTAGQEPSLLLSYKIDHMQKNGLFEDCLDFGILAFGVMFEGSLQNVSFTERLCKRLNLVGHLIHPDVKEGLSLLHDFVFHQFTKGLDLGYLHVKDQVFKGFKVGHTCHLGDLTDRTLSQFRQIVLLFLHVAQDILNNLLHQNAVITFSGHT